MTIQELNTLPFIASNVERIIHYLEMPNTYPDFFLPFDEPVVVPARTVWESELPELMGEYRRIHAYIDTIPEPWMRRMFEQRYIERKSFAEIGVEHGLDSGVVKQELYGYVHTHPEGYTCSRDLSQKWGVGMDAINHWCRLGLLPGAVKRKGYGSNGHRVWMIPSDAQYPPSLRRCKYQKRGRNKR